MEQALLYWLAGSTAGFFIALGIAVWHDRQANTPAHAIVSLVLYPVAFVCAISAFLPSLMSLVLLIRGFYTFPSRPLNTPPDKLGALDRKLVAFMEFVQNPFEPMGVKPPWPAPASPEPEPEPEPHLDEAPAS